MAMKKDTLHKMILTTAKRLEGYGNEDSHFRTLHKMTTAKRLEGYGNEDSLHKMILTAAKRLEDYENEDLYFTQDDTDHSKTTRRL